MQHLHWTSHHNLDVYAVVAFSVDKDLLDKRFHNINPISKYIYIYF